MTTIANLLTSLVLAVWVVAIAILAIQNAAPISLKFLSFQSIQLPIGLVLAFSAGVGVAAGAIAPLLWQLLGTQGNGVRSSSERESDPEDF